MVFMSDNYTNGGLISKEVYDKLCENINSLDDEIPVILPQNEKMKELLSKLSNDINCSLKIPNSVLPNLKKDSNKDTYECVDMQKEQLERKQRGHM
jgi:hypothetical protein